MAKKKRKAAKAKALVGNSLVASAMRMSGPGAVGGKWRAPDASWEAEAWRYFNSLGEVRFAASWIGNALSRVRLYAAQTQGGGQEPQRIDTGPAAEAVDALASGPGGQAEMLRRLGVILTVAGSGFLLGEPGDDGDLRGARWLVVSGSELKRSSTNGYALDEGGRNRTLHPDTLVTRVWRAHPRLWWEADSPIRAALPILAELELLSAHVFATAQSRLTGAGILIIPQELSFPAGGPGTGPELAASDPFLEDLTESMVTAIEDRSSAAAVVPIVLRLPAEHAGAIRHITFSTPFDAEAKTLRDEAIRRFATAMDLPAEIVTGMGGTNHWGSWQIAESAIQIHVVPLAQLICDALTDSYLAPTLEAGGVDPTGMVVQWDTTPLTQRPNLATDARELFDREAINADTLRRVTGFADDDAPTADELRLKLVMHLAETQPALAPCLLPLLGIELPESCLIPGITPLQEISVTPPQSIAPNAPAALPRPEATQPAPGSQTRTPPNTSENNPNPGEAALVAACDQIMMRALERAGSRLRSVNRLRAEAGDAGPCEVHVRLGGVATSRHADLLAGAWERVPEIAGRYGADPECVALKLDGMLRQLLLAGEPYRHEALAASGFEPCLA